MKFEQIINELTNNLTGQAPVQNQAAGATKPNPTTVTTPPANQAANQNQKPDIKALAQQLSTMNKPEEIEKVLSTLLQ